MRAVVLFVAALAGTAADSLYDHPMFELTNWLSDTETWYRNGKQPWWVEEQLPGRWFESWYEKEINREARTVMLHDWSRAGGLLSTVGPATRSVVSEHDNTIPAAVRPGRWGARSVCFDDSCIRMRGMHEFTLEFGEEDSPADTIPLRLVSEQSSQGTLVLVNNDGSAAPRKYRLLADGTCIEENPETGKVEKRHRSEYVTEVNKIEIIRDLEPDVVINPGMPIAMLTLNTPQIHNWAKYAEVNQIHYANKYGYTLYIYRQTLMPRATVTWNKIHAIPKHLPNHDYLMWIDADAIITDMDKKIEDIIIQAPEKDFLACGDIGGWLLNTGVMIFKNSDWAKKLIADLWAQDHWGHDRGAEQNQLIRMFKTSYKKWSSTTNGWKVFPECEFNCHPRHHKHGHYIMHMMGDSGENRKNTFTVWNNRLGVDMKNSPHHEEL